MAGLTDERQIEHKYIQNPMLSTINTLSHQQQKIFLKKKIENDQSKWAQIKATDKNIVVLITVKLSVSFSCVRGSFEYENVASCATQCDPNCLHQT